MSKNKNLLWITNSSDDRIMLRPPVILRQWILGGIMVTGLQFSEMLVALPIDEADILNKPDVYSESQKKSGAVEKKHLCKGGSKPTCSGKSANSLEPAMERMEWTALYPLRQPSKWKRKGIDGQ